MPYANVVCLEPLSNGIPDERWISIERTLCLESSDST